MPPSPDAPGSVAFRPLWNPRQLRWLTALALAGSLALRGILLLRGGITGESLASVGGIAAGVSPLASSPLERILTAGAVALGPLEYWPLAALLLALWALYCAAAWLACRSLSGSPAKRLVLLLLAIFSPMTVAGFSAWPIGVEATAVAVGVLLVIHGASSLRRSGRLPSSWTMVAGTAVALAGSPLGPWSPALLVPLWAVVLVLLPGPSGLGRADTTDHARPSATAMASLAIPLLLTVAWAVMAGKAPVSALPRDMGPVAGFLGQAIGSGAIPSLVGGPASWEYTPAWPSATAPVLIAFMGLQVILAALFASAALARKGLAPWGIGLGFAALSVVLFALSTDPVLAGSGAQMLGLYAVPAFLLIACSSSLSAPGPQASIPWLRGTTSAVAAFLAIDVFLALSVMSALAWSDARGLYAGRDYVRQAEASLTVADRSTPLLPQVVPVPVADPRLAPLNRTDVVFAPVAARPEFAAWTTDLRAFDDKGVLRPATLQGIDVPVACTTWAPGIALAQALPEFTYVIAIDLAEHDPAGFLVQLGDGPPVTVPAGVGTGTIYAQVSGSGSVLSLSPLGNRPLCPTAVAIGQVQPVVPEDGSAAP